VNEHFRSQIMWQKSKATTGT